MKYTIFCLLACCAFEAVFTDKSHKDLQNLRDISINKIMSVLVKLGSAAEVAMEAAAKKGVKYEDLADCLEDYQNFSFQTPRNQCCECHDKAAKHNNIKLAKKCYLDIIAAFENEGKRRRANIKACFAKAVHEVQAAAVKKTKKL